MRTSTDTRTKTVVLGFVAVAAFFLLTEHRAHVIGLLPYALILACPLHHLFHGHGHSGHGESVGHAEAGENRS